MIIVKNRIAACILPGRFPAMCIWPFILIRPDSRMGFPEIMKHERIHARQQLEMAWLFFFVWYILEFIVRFAIYRDHMRAYQSLSHEREAYQHGSDPDYLKKRKAYAWVKYL